MIKRRHHWQCWGISSLMGILQNVLILGKLLYPPETIQRSIFVSWACVFHICSTLYKYCSKAKVTGRTLRMRSISSRLFKQSRQDKVWELGEVKSKQKARCMWLKKHTPRVLAGIFIESSKKILKGGAGDNPLPNPAILFKASNMPLIPSFCKDNKSCAWCQLQVSHTHISYFF